MMAEEYNINKKNKTMFIGILARKTSSGGGGVDTDAQAFLDATVITDETISASINDLVVGLKVDNLWNKIRAVYPFVGGTADTHKYNLKDSRDLDVAFRLTWGTGHSTSPHSHSANGIKPVGTSYAITHFSEEDELDLNNIHLSIYSRTDISAWAADIGSEYSVSVRSAMMTKFGVGLLYSALGTGTSSVTYTDNSQAMYLISRTSSAGVDTYRNKVKLSYPAVASRKTTIPFYISAMSNIDSTPTIYSPRELAFATIGEGLTENEQNKLYDRVQTFQTSLNRQF